MIDGAASPGLTPLELELVAIWPDGTQTLI
jgi:hypothetical protein